MLHDKTILLVEDYDVIRTVYRLVLEQSGYHVREAANGLDCVHLAEAHTPDLILLDISMPIMDGWQAMRRLKSYPETADIPVIIMTARNSSEDRRRARAAGCETVLVKPCAVRRVLHEAERHIGLAVAAT